MLWKLRGEWPPPDQKRGQKIGKDAWMEAEVSLKDVQESEAFSKKGEQHMQHRDPGENDTVRPEILWHCSGQLQQLQGDQEIIHTSMTCEEFGFYPRGNGEPL